MRTTIARVEAASHRDELANVRPVPAKAEHRAQVGASALRELAFEAIRRTHGKALVAADVVGISESQLGRLVNDGDLKLKQLEALGPETLAVLGRELLDTYGPLATPKARAKARIRDARAILDELDQVLELIA
jgi:hypothetical protein